MPTTLPLPPSLPPTSHNAKTNPNGCVAIGVIGVNEGGKVVIINVGGQRHEALKKNFDKFPQERRRLTDRQTLTDVTTTKHRVW